MAVRVIMPKAGMAMEQGTIVKWLKKEGDRVAKGEALLEILTDKVNMEVESMDSGVLLKILRFEDEVVPVTETIGYIGEAGEKIELPSSTETIEGAKSEVPAGEDKINKAQRKMENINGRVAATPLAKTIARSMGIDITTAMGTGSFGQVLARDIEGLKPVGITPLAKRIADDRGLDVSSIKGRGFGGKITRDDVLKNIEDNSSIETVSTGKIVRKPMAGMRRVIGDRMLKSHLEAPPVTMDVRVDVTELSILRNKMNKALDMKISYNDFILKACAMALKEFPYVNVSIEGGDILYKEDINIGMAVALDDGLIVPVIKNTDAMSVKQISQKSRELAGKAREGRLSPDEYTGGTFTVSNLGMYDIVSFTPILTPPESAILGVCAIEETLKMSIDDKIVKKLVMGLSLTFDHRAIDGAQAAVFQRRIKSILENPYEILG